MIVPGGNVNLTCSATFGSENGSTPHIDYVWSGPAMRDYGNNHILLLQDLHISDAGQYMCTASFLQSSITAGIPVALQSKHL